MQAAAACRRTKLSAASSTAVQLAGGWLGSTFTGMRLRGVTGVQSCRFPAQLLLLVLLLVVVVVCTATPAAWCGCWALDSTHLPMHPDDSGLRPAWGPGGRLGWLCAACLLPREEGALHSPCTTLTLRRQLAVSVAAGARCRQVLLEG
ncbi:hypothetical protein V8C86DRAFT_728346 [Haematococcus lacustris]